MLNPSEKAKIQAEEIYRREVANELDKKKKKQSPVLTFFNSALGIWFLSTIVIGLFTYYYNRWEINRKEHSLREQTIRQLDLEIESRMSQFWVNLEPVFRKEGDTAYTFKFGFKKDTILSIWKAFKDAPSLNPRVMSPMFKEYDTRNTVSLIIELADLLEDGPVKKNKTEPGNDIDSIRRAAAFIAGNGPVFDTHYPELIELNPSKIWRSFNDNIIIRRWDKLFPYTDCLFC